MISFVTGNLLEAKAEALVNTVNTVGVMGKGVALMFKDAYPENFRAYASACKDGRVRVGSMFVVERSQLIGPQWIINFPTKDHWRNPSKLEWIEAGLDDLVRIIKNYGIRSIAIPPLGSGNGGLEWSVVRSLIVDRLADIPFVNVLIYEPSAQYQNVAKRLGVKQLTPARALMAELVRRYWVLGFECSVLEIQKLAYFLEQEIETRLLPNPLSLKFRAGKYGPYADRLRHLLDGLDGSYLHCDKRLGDATPTDAIWFEDSKSDHLSAYLSTSEAQQYSDALHSTIALIEGFESPLGMELLATVDWMLNHEGCLPTIEGLKAGLGRWPGGAESAERKIRLFSDRMLSVALGRLHPSE